MLRSANLHAIFALVLLALTASDARCAVANICVTSQQRGRVLVRMSVSERGLMYRESLVVFLSGALRGSTTRWGRMTMRTTATKRVKLYSFTSNLSADLSSGAVGVAYPLQTGSVRTLITQFGGGNVSGAIDGRDIVPMLMTGNLTGVQMVDGLPAPGAFNVTDDLQASALALVGRARIVASGCRVVQTTMSAPVPLFCSQTALASDAAAAAAIRAAQKSVECISCGESLGGPNSIGATVCGPVCMLGTLDCNSCINATNSVVSAAAQSCASQV